MSVLTTQLNKHQLGSWLGLSPQTIIKMAREGRIPGRLIAGRWRFDQRQIERWIAAQPGQVKLPT